MQNLTWTLILIVIYVIWAVTFYFIMRIGILSFRSKNWPVTEGEVVVSKSKKLKPSETGIIVNKYRAIIRYEYIVNDLTHSSEVVSFGELAFQFFNRGLRSKKGVEYLMLKYPMGGKVTVYYDPDYPARAVLESGIFDFNLILIIVILGIVGLLLFIPLLTLI